jgi:cytochrome P450
MAMNIIDRPQSAAALYPPTAVPSPKPLPLWRFLWRFVDNPLRALPQQVYEEPLVVYAKSRGGLVWVTSPALIERILLQDHEKFTKTTLEKRVFKETLGDGILTSEGASWRWQRRIAAPLFRHQDLLGYVPTMVAAAEEEIARWRASPPGSVQAIDRSMTDATFRVITSTILAGADTTEGETVKRAGVEFLSPITWEIAYALMRFPEWLWHPAKSRIRRAGREMRAAVASIIARRRAEGGKASDLLGRLLAARDPDSAKPMSDRQLVDNLLTFLAAGHETTAKALTWTLYLLARAPEWQRRVREEVERVAGSDPIEARHLAALEVTQRVLKESMRLYPPAPVLSRTTAETVDLAGWRLGKGTLIIVPVFAVHRHRKLWEDPDRFDPDRFLPEREAGRPRAQYLPFGFGPRTCIGASFAMIEAAAMLATFVRAARFEWDGVHLPEPISRVTLRPKGGMPLSVFCR